MTPSVESKHLSQNHNRSAHISFVIGHASINSSNKRESSAHSLGATVVELVTSSVPHTQISHFEPQLKLLRYQLAITYIEESLQQ